MRKGISIFILVCVVLVLIGCSQIADDRTTISSKNTTTVFSPNHTTDENKTTITTKSTDSDETTPATSQPLSTTLTTTVPATSKPLSTTSTTTVPATSQPLLTTSTTTAPATSKPLSTVSTTTKPPPITSTAATKSTSENRPTMHLVYDDMKLVVEGVLLDRCAIKTDDGTYVGFLAVLKAVGYAVTWESSYRAIISANTGRFCLDVEEPGLYSLDWGESAFNHISLDRYMGGGTA